MKIHKHIAALFLPLLALCASCGNGKLSQSEAKKQIEERLADDSMHRYIYETITGGMSPINVPSSKTAPLERLHEAGFLDYKLERWTDPYILTMSTVIFLYPKEKLKQYLTGNYGYFTERGTPQDGVNNVTHMEAKVGTHTYTAKITSITEAAPNSDGKIVCSVDYLKHCATEVNEIGRLCSIKLNASDSGTVERTAEFVKTQDGWELTRTGGY